MLFLLLGLASSECYLSDPLFNWKNEQEGSEKRLRYEAAAKMCRDTFQEEPKSLLEWDNAEEGFQLTSAKVVFYANKESSVRIDLNKIFSRGKPAAGNPRAKVYVGGDGPVSVTVESDSSTYPQWGTIGLELMDSVSKLIIGNKAEGMAGKLVVDEFNDRATQCEYASDTANVKPSISATYLVLSDNLLRRRQEGSVTFEATYNQFIVDENMLTGEITGLEPSFTEPEKGDDETQGTWTVRKESVYEVLFIHILIRAPVSLTIGKLSTKLETENKALFIDIGTRDGYFQIDVQDETVDVDFYCEDGVTAEEFVGGEITYNKYDFASLYEASGETTEELFCKIKFHGDNWPYLVPLDEADVQIKTETKRDSTAKVITVTTYFRKIMQLFYLDAPTNQLHFNLTDNNLPVKFSGYRNIVLHPEASNVGFQGALGVPSYASQEVSFEVRVPEGQKCTLHVERVNCDQNGNVRLTVIRELTVVVKKCEQKLLMPCPFMCDTIWATGSYVDASDLTLTDNGNLIMSHVYPEKFPTLSGVWEKTSEHVWFESGNASTALWDDWTYLLKFVTDNKKDLSDAVSKDFLFYFPSKVTTLTIGEKVNVQVMRQETFPVAALYSKSPMTIACLANGAPEVKNWNVSFQSFLSEDSPGPTYFGQYFPEMSELGINSFSLLQSASQSCLEVKIDQPPNSAFVFVVYASNKTYVDILSEFPSYVTLVTDKTIDSDVTLSNPNCKNVVVLFLDSVPTGKNLRLGKVRSDGNVYVAGVPFEALDHIFKVIAAGSDKESTNFNDLVQAMINALVNEHSKFFPAVSITTNHISSLLVASANYIGTKVDCDNFYACGSTFPDGFSVTASYTLADTFSYKSLEKVSLNNLCLFPVSTSPADHLSVSTVEYGPNGITLKGNKGYFEFAGSQTKEVAIPVTTSNVKGVLHLVTFTDGLKFDIPTGVIVEKVKGISAVMGADFNNLQISNLLPVLPLLSEEEEGPIRNVISALKKTFHAKNLATDKTVQFTGSWDKVKEIEGSFSIDAAADPVAVQNVPANVIQKLQVKSSATADITVPETVTEIHMDTQVVKGQSQMSFGSAVTITFENLTFAAGTAGKIETSSFALLVQNKEVPIVANHVKCSDYVQAFISDLSIQKSVEVGRVASMQAGKLNTKEFGVTLHYSFEDGFSGFFDGLDFVPNALKLFYDGDGAGVDIESYRQTPLAIRTLKTAEECNTWKSKVSYDSSNPDFAGSRSRATASCTDNVLVLTLGDVKEDDPIPVGAIVGGVIGALVVIGVIVAAVILILKKRKKDELNSHESSENTVSVNTD